MLGLRLSRSDGEPLRLLCLGAHSDDIEIGCGGTLLRLLGERDEVHVRWVVMSGADAREQEAHASAERLAERAASLEVDVLGFRDGYFPDQWTDLKRATEELKGEAEPDLIFTHRGVDRHQDHRVVSELTWQTFRDHLVLEYEIPKYEGDLGRPNLYVPLSQETARRKAEHLLEFFPSQREKHWFDEETFRALARLRGVEARSETNYAEAFVGRKSTLVLGPGDAGISTLSD